jgi:hypothetical protein
MGRLVGGWVGYGNVVFVFGTVLFLFEHCTYFDRVFLSNGVVLWYYILVLLLFWSSFILTINWFQYIAIIRQYTCIIIWSAVLAVIIEGDLGIIIGLFDIGMRMIGYIVR